MESLVLDNMLIHLLTHVYMCLVILKVMCSFLVHQNIWFVRVCVTAFPIFVTTSNIRW